MSVAGGMVPVLRRAYLRPPSVQVTAARRCVRGAGSRRCAASDSGRGAAGEKAYGNIFIKHARLTFTYSFDARMTGEDHGRSRCEGGAVASTSARPSCRQQQQQ